MAIGAAFLVPVQASASNAYFTAPATKGYRAKVHTYHYGVVVSLTRVKGPNPKRGSWVSYLAHTNGRLGHLTAVFGDLGTMNLRFHPSGIVTHTKPEQGCHGPDRYTYRRGSYVGNLKLRGEGDFTSVHIHQAAATIVSPTRLFHCAPEGSTSPSPAPPLRRTTFAAFWHSGVVAQEFQARASEKGGTEFEASTNETRGSLAIYKTAYVRAPHHDFVTDKALGFATLTPPPPFSGVGYLHRRATGAREWTGTLGVSFPGHPQVPLTGSPFKTYLSRSW